MNKVSIIGGGPTGLMCAFFLLKNHISVDLYEKTSGVGKKFLVAGHSGLNLTHSDSLELMSTRFGRNKDIFKDLISDFNAEDLRKWCEELGIDTFIGTSGRVFPKEMKAAQILIKWMELLKANDHFKLHTHHELTSLCRTQETSYKLLFKNNEDEVKVFSPFVVLAMGGASWSKTGSDGNWSQLLLDQDVEVAEFKSMNCGFETNWSEFYKEKFETEYIKNTEVSLRGSGKNKIKGELMLTQYGIEGAPIYGLSYEIQEFLKTKDAVLIIDLKPDLSETEILKRLEEDKSKNSLSNKLRKKLNLPKSSISLIMELTTKTQRLDLKTLCHKIKHLELTLVKARPIDEAISTIGGVPMKEVSKSLELHSLGNIYLGGEMLDWEAPTGGYLLQGCFSMGYRIARSILTKIDQ
jgi:uncharacterized flavoprotein (TIGR03862 family)